MNLNEIFAENLIKCRKTAKITQTELAEKLNYSDKSISKWERAEGMPDLETAKIIADLFGVSVDYLITKHNEKPLINGKITKKRAIMSIIASVIVWLIAVSVYAFLGVLIPSLINKTWLSFIWAIPITFLILVILTSVWGKNLYNLIFLSILVWSFISSIYLTLINFLENYPHTLWMIFLIGIPIQTLLILYFTFKKVK